VTLAACAPPFPVQLAAMAACALLVMAALGSSAGDPTRCYRLQLELVRLRSQIAAIETEMGRTCPPIKHVTTIGDARNEASNLDSGVRAEHTKRRVAATRTPLPMTIYAGEANGCGDRGIVFAVPLSLSQVRSHSATLPRSYAHARLATRGTARRALHGEADSCCSRARNGTT
jgi:hypothetical protein